MIAHFKDRERERNDCAARILVRQTQPHDFQQIVELTSRVYPHARPYGMADLASQHAAFPDGQLVAIDTWYDRVVGMAASLIVRWRDYEITDSWRTFTAGGTFTNHDPENGHTLYGAEVMVDPQMQGCGIGKKLYEGRFDICRRHRLLRIRAGARLRGYSKYAAEMTPEQYVQRVVSGQIGDPTLSFQLKRGFRVIAVVQSYLQGDPASRDAAAIIEWINRDLVRIGQPRAKRTILKTRLAEVAAP